MTLCEQALVYLGAMAGTFFWLWYLTWEMTHYKRRGSHKPRWYERDITRGKHHD
jgi:hypothetical protein